MILTCCLGLTNSALGQSLVDQWRNGLSDTRLTAYSGSVIRSNSTTDATDAAGVNRAELAEFREYVEPNLRAIAENPPDFEEWQERNSASLGDISPWAMMREDFGLLDILFIFLGVGTAFRLASQRD